jgi:hypothetical protein
MPSECNALREQASSPCHLGSSFFLFNRAAKGA